jgi:ubiquitin C-terminal hydrolase
MQTYNIEAVPQPFGLINPGVICHFNALLQSLVSCPQLVEVIYTNHTYLSQTITGKALYNFVYAAVPHFRHASEKAFTASTTPSVLQALITDLRSRKPTVQYGHSQESTSEGLILLLEMIEIPHTKSPITRLFLHRFEECVICKCGHSITQTDSSVHFNLFSLGSEINNPEKFAEVMKGHETEIVDYTCDSCKVTGLCQKKYTLQMIPEILVCILNKYGTRCAQYFPELVQFPSISGEKLKYCQVAQVEHSGTLRSGHYCARALRQDKNVYALNDMRISKSEFGPQCETYMVWYCLTD